MTGIPSSRRRSASGSARHPTAAPLPRSPLAADFDRLDFFHVVLGYPWNLIGIDTHEPTLYAAALMMGSPSFGFDLGQCSEISQELYERQPR
jgi:hypothetical protein